MKRVLMLGVVIMMLVFSLQAFGQSISVESVVYPSDVIVFDVKELEAIKKEAMKYSLAKAFSIAKTSKDETAAVTIEEISKRGISSLKPFSLFDVNLSLIKESSDKEIIEGENFVVDAYLYGIIQVKKDNIVKISKEWHTSFERIVEGLREAIRQQIRAGQQISSPLDPIEPLSINFRTCIFITYKEKILFRQIERRKEVLKSSWPRNTIIILKAETAGKSPWKFSYWKVEKDKGLVKEISLDTLKVKLSDAANITAVFEK